MSFESSPYFPVRISFSSKTGLVFGQYSSCGGEKVSVRVYGDSTVASMYLLAIAWL